MAFLPPLRRISKEDLGPDVPDWGIKLIGLLNPFLDAVYRNLAKALTFPDNIRSDTKTFDITAGAAADDNTYQFVNTIGVKPQGLTILSVNERDNFQAPILNPVGLTWYWDGINNNITAITGLTTGVIYRITVLVI